MDTDLRRGAEFDPRGVNPFAVYDREVRRLRDHFHRLKAKDWSAASHCRGWSVKDVVAHLSTNEVYNQACLDDALEQLPFARGLLGWNDRGVRVRRSMHFMEVLQEWEARQERVRRAWARIGLNETIKTRVGRYPLRLRVWHLAREYAIHADDVKAPLSPRERARELRWRAEFGIFAAREEGEAIDARLTGGGVQLRLGGRVHDLELETFIAYLTKRPQQLNDASKRKLVRRLIESASA